MHIYIIIDLSIQSINMSSFVASPTNSQKQPIQVDMMKSHVLQPH